MTQKICALLQRKPESTFALDKAPQIKKVKKPLIEKPIKPMTKRKTK